MAEIYKYAGVNTILSFCKHGLGSQWSENKGFY